MGLEMNSVDETARDDFLMPFKPEVNKPEVESRPEIINVPHGEKVQDKFITEEQRELLLPQILVRGCPQMTSRL